MDTLDIDEMMAQLLVAEGFTNLEEVAYVDQDELLSIDGFDEGTAEELQARARDFIWKNRPARRWKPPARWVSKTA
jgi:N utilization substance protein A